MMHSVLLYTKPLDYQSVPGVQDSRKNFSVPLNFTCTFLRPDLVQLRSIKSSVLIIYQKTIMVLTMKAYKQIITEINPFWDENI